LSIEIQWLHVDKIHLNDYNPNVMDAEKFEALCEFLRSHGAQELDPIWVRHDGVDGFEVIDGEHRWKAAKEVGWKKLRGFVVDLDLDKARAFNERKNRERGRLDAYKMGKILYEEYEKGQTQNGVGKKFGLNNRTVSEYIAIYENNEAIRERLNISATAELHFRRARDVLRELKREERGEPKESTLTTEEITESQQLKKFLTNYAKGLKNNPLPKVQEDEIQVAIRFFKRLLKKKQIHCPICGQEHLQWRCGHEF